jgi:hypothetical protein
MVTVLRPGSANRYISKDVSAGVWGREAPFNYRLVGGTVGRQQDATQLRTPADYVTGFRLDFKGSPFRADMPTIETMEFTASDPRYFVIPLGAPALPYPDDHLPDNYSEVRKAAYAMVSAARGSDLDPNSYRMELRTWPYTGTGITGDPNLGFPERSMSFVEVPQAATIFEINQSAVKTPVAIYRGAVLGWEGLR